MPETPILASPHRRPTAVVESATDLVAWNLLELVTVMVVTVLTVVRRITGGRQRPQGEP